MRFEFGVSLNCSIRKLSSGVTEAIVFPGTQFLPFVTPQIDGGRELQSELLLGTVLTLGRFELRRNHAALRALLDREGLSGDPWPPVNTPKVPESTNVGAWLLPLSLSFAHAQDSITTRYRAAVPANLNSKRFSPGRSWNRDQFKSPI